MKHKEITFRAALSAIALSAILAGCASQQSTPTQPVQTPTTQQQPVTSIEINVPYAEYTVDTDKAYRAVGHAQEREYNDALDRAQLVAYRQILMKVEATLRAVSEDYSKITGADGLKTNQNLFERMFRAVADNTLHELRQIDKTRTFRTSDGMYEVYLPYEFGRDKVKRLAIAAVLPQEDVARVDADKQKFLENAFARREAQEIRALRDAKGALPKN